MGMVGQKKLSTIVSYNGIIKKLFSASFNIYKSWRGESYKY